MRNITKFRKPLIVLLFILVLVSCLGAGCTKEPLPDTSIQIPSRSEVSEQYKWDLTSFYESRDAFDSDVALLKEKYIPKLEAYKGNLRNADNLLSFFQLDTEASVILENVHVYPNLLADLDQTNTEATEMVEIASSVRGEYASAISFAEPEILALDEAMIRSFMDDPRMTTYRYYLQTLLDRKEHVLSDGEEQILAYASEISGSPESIFDKAMFADLENPTILDEDGKEVELTPAVYADIMEGPDREFRKAAYEAKCEALREINYTLAATYIAEVKLNIFFAKARKYDSALEATLASRHIPRSIYDNVVASVNANLDYLHKYFALQRRVLDMDELHGYDTGLPLVEDYNFQLSYDEAAELIAAALKPLGDDYVADFNNGIRGRWVDVYPDEHKYTGGYQWGTYTSHPYILMNYNNSLRSVLTLAHEMGHALNTAYSNRAQDYWNADYPIFTAEAASTANEFLVMDYLIENAKTDDEKLYLLLKQIDNIRGTVYLQVMFSEFEQTVHEKVEAGEPLSAEVLNNLYLELIQKYYGADYTVDEIVGVYWSRIPHFYSAFYVYQYATSMAASYQLVNNIIEGKEGAIDSYLTFLAAGGSDYPVEILKNAGVDMNSSSPVDNLLAYFGELVDEAEGLLLEEHTEN